MAMHPPVKIGETYKAVQCTKLYKNFDEAIDKLEIVNVKREPLAADQIRVKIYATSLNYFDLLTLVGRYQMKPDIPFTVSTEASGEIIEIGSEISRFKVGDGVIFGLQVGAMAEEVVISEGFACKKPSSMDHVHASGVFVGFTTAYHGLAQRANIQRGEYLLVTGAGGGMGTAAIQVGKLLGAIVIAAAGSPEKLYVAKKMGADYLVNYSTEDMKEKVSQVTGGRFADVVYDNVGGEIFDKCVRSMAENGRLLVVGFASGTIPKFPINLALVKGFSVVGVRAGAQMTLHPELAREMYQKIEEWGLEGKLIPYVDQVFDKENFRDAFRIISHNKALGKVVVKWAVHHAKL